MGVKVGVIGTGNMGGAIIKGLLSNHTKYEVYAFDINKQLTERLSGEYPVTAMPSIQALAEKSDVVIAAVKPQNMESVLKECSKTLNRSTLFVSVAVGLPIAYYSKILGSDKK